MVTSETTPSRLSTAGLTEFLSRFSGQDRAAHKTATPARLLDASRTPYGPFHLKAQVSRGAEYHIMASPDLQNWLPVGRDRAGADTIEFVDHEASKFSSRFYRVIVGELPSLNVMGYATVTFPPGYSMIANPFSNRANTVGELLTRLPDGATLNKYDTREFRLTENEFRGGKWRNPSEKLVVGEGAIILNPTSDYLSLSFSGEVMEGNLFNPIPAGFSIRSSLVPRPGRLVDDLAFPAAEGDKIHIFDRDKQQYVIHEYDPKTWAANQPVIGVGESFWVGKTSPGNWVRNFTIGT